MQIDIRDNIRDVTRWLSDAEKKQIPFATILAMTLTARDARDAEIPVIRRVFDRPTPYTMAALQAVPATKSKPIASVEFRQGGGGTPAKRFLNPQVHGGGRSQKSTERDLLGRGWIASLLGSARHLVPARGYPLDSFGNIKPATYKKIKSQLQVGDAFQWSTGSRRSKKKRAATGYFVAGKGSKLPPGIYERRGKDIKGVLMAVKAPRYSRRFPFEETTQATVEDRFEPNFRIALERAMANSGYKSAAGGNWRY